MQKRKEQDDEAGYMEDEMQEALKKIEERKAQQDATFKASLKNRRIATPGSTRDVGSPRPTTTAHLRGGP